MDLDLIGISESWCKEDIKDAEIKLEDYVVYRKDRVEGKGGGVLLYVSNKLKSIPCHELNSLAFEESIWRIVSLENGNNLLVGVIYRSPNSSIGNNKELLNMMNSIDKVKGIHDILIMGDFNYPEIDYVNEIVDGPAESNAHDFFDCTKRMILRENIKECTRFRGQQIPSRLDYILTRGNIIDRIQKLPPLGKSDHIGIQASVLVDVEVLHNDEDKKRNYRKANFEKIKDDMRKTNWDLLLYNNDVEGMWNIFRDKVLDWESKHVPFRPGDRKIMKNKWLQKDTKKTIIERNKLWKLFCRTGRAIDYDNYKEVRNLACKSVKSNKEDYELGLIKHFKDNPKGFYKYIRNSQKVKDRWLRESNKYRPGIS